MLHKHFAKHTTGSWNILQKIEIKNKCNIHHQSDKNKVDLDITIIILQVFSTWAMPC